MVDNPLPLRLDGSAPSPVTGIRVAHRSLGFGGIVVIAVTCSALALLACAGGQQGAGGAGDEAAASELLQRARQNPTPNPDQYRRILEKFGSTHAAGGARQELAGMLLSRARSALDARDFRSADDAAEEARTYGTEEQTRQAHAMLDAIDDGRAAAIAQQVAGLAGAEGGCMRAFAAVVAPLSAKPRPRPRFKEALRAQTAPTLVQCLGVEIESRFREGDGRTAMALLVTPEVTVALAKEAYDKAVLRLTGLVVARTQGELGPVLGERKWAEAFAEVARRHEGGELEDRESEAVLVALRERIRADVLQRIEAARASQRTTRDAAGIRDLVRLAEWEPVPEDVARGLEALGRSLECEKLRCAPEKPTQVWAWGALSLSPPDAADGAPAGHLEHGQPAFRVARAGARALVATSDPGSAAGPALLDAAAGWVDASRLRPVSTADWLPPPEVLSGVRVWGPLREGAREYSLGVVTSADPKRAIVRRLADSLEITVDTRLLRLGTVPPGMKVLAYCVDRIHAEPAKIDGTIVAQGDVEKVPVVCERGALAHVEMLSALGADPAWLPPRKP
jgi:hypothetical protein